MARIALILALVVVARTAGAQPVAETTAEDQPLFRCKQRTSGDVQVTFKAETELKDLVAWVMGFTCKNFLYDPRIVVTGRKVTLIVPGKLSPAAAYDVFLAALSTIGLTVVPRGAVYRIVETAQAKKEPIAIRKTAPGDVDQVVRYVYAPTAIAPEALVQAWAAIKSDAGDVQLVGKLVIVTDYGSTVQQMLAMAKLVDVAGASDAIYTLPVLHADAAKLADKLTTILGLGGGGGGGGKAAKPEPATTRLVVDERTNTLILTGNAASYQRVKALADRLDVALEIEGGSAIHVYPLSSAIAEELARTLTAAIGDKQPKAGPPAAAPASPPGLDSLGTALEGQVRVIADPPTNALIVLSSGHDFFAIKDVIRQLDLPRRQVYIEAMILEVAATDETSVGTSAHGGDTVGDSAGVVLGGVETSDVNTIGITSALGAGAIAGSSGLLAGLIGSALKSSTSLLGASIPSFAVLFRAVADQSTTRIISTPSIIAVDNVEAKYKIGTNIPVPSASVSTGVAVGGLPAGTTSTSVDHKDLPLTLDIKPHISSDDSVLLEVKHESLDKTGDTASGPIWSTRSFETRVLVRDQQTVVLGGLTQDKEVSQTTKVPILGDIPLLGYLFKTTTRARSRTNLLVLLTPYIIKDQRELQAIQQRKLREHDDFARSARALDHFKYEPVLDYGKKRGLVEEINRAVLDAEHEAAQLQQLPRAATVPAGPLEPAPAD
jgi:general secretion pathway protein D